MSFDKIIILNFLIKKKLLALFLLFFKLLSLERVSGSGPNGEAQNLKGHLSRSQQWRLGVVRNYGFVLPFVVD